jgi:hypothetical protein
VHIVIQKKETNNIKLKYYRPYIKKRSHGNRGREGSRQAAFYEETNPLNFTGTLNQKKREPELPWFDLVDALGIEPSGP